MDFAEDLQDTTGWVAWGINPTGIYMPGTQALAAFSNSSGVVVKEYNVTEAVFNGQANLMSGPVSLNYTDISAVLSGTTMTIFGTLALGAGKSTSLNHVWNRGPSVTSPSTLTPHPVSGDNIQGYSTIDMSSGIATAFGLPHQSLKNVSIFPFIQSEHIYIAVVKITKHFNSFWTSTLLGLCFIFTILFLLFSVTYFINVGGVCAIEALETETGCQRVISF